MDDFYVYYEPLSDNLTKGTIKAISPNALKEMGDMDYIRIPAERGLEFTIGDESISLWMIGWDSDVEDMAMVKYEPEVAVGPGKVPLREIPTRQSKPYTVITYSKGKREFFIRTKGISLSHQNVNMTFFVTREGDPNIPFFHFSTPLFDTMARKGVTVTCDVELPDQFSVFTKPELERYQLRTTR